MARAKVLYEEGNRVQDMPGTPALQFCIRQYSRWGCYSLILRAAILVPFFLLILPLGLGLIFGIAPPLMLSLIGSTLLLQAAASAVGLGLGIPPLLVLVLTTSVAVAVMLAMLYTLDIFAQQSRRLQDWVRRVDERMQKYTVLKRYGVLMLIPIIWIPGIALYGTPIVAWILRFNRQLSIVAMVAGWTVASVVVMATALGLVSLIF